MANKTMHHVVIGSDTFEIVDQYAREHSVTDTTLSISGSAADAKAVGDALEGKADSDDVTALETTLESKADSSDVTALGTRVTAVEGDVDALDRVIYSTASDTYDTFVQGVRYPETPYTISTSSHRCTTPEPIHMREGDTLSTAVPTGYRVTVVDSTYHGYGWVTGEYVFTASAECDAFVNVANVTESTAISPSDFDITIIFDENSSRMSGLERAVESIEDSIGVYEITEWVHGKYLATSGSTVNPQSPAISASYKYAIVSCSEGDKFTVSGTGGSAPRLWAFADASNNVLSNSASSITVENLVITAPDDASYLVINDSSDSTSYKGVTMPVQIEDIVSKSDALNSVVIEETGYNPISVSYENKYIDTSGSVADITRLVNFPGFMCSLVPCTAGDVFTISALGGSAPKAWAFVDASGNVLRKTTTTDVNNQVEIAPKNSAYLVINDKGGRTSLYGKTVAQTLTDDVTGTDYMQKAIRRITGELKAKSPLGNLLVFGFNTDQHIRDDDNRTVTLPVLRGLRALSELTHAYPYDFVCLGGDACEAGSYAVTPELILDECVTIQKPLHDAWCPVVPITGNHDAAQNNNTITGGMLFNAHFKRIANSGYLKGWDSTHTNGYIDFASHKIRVIFVDTTLRADYTAEERQQALTTMLASTPQDYSIITISHHALNNTLGAKWGTIIAYQSILSNYASRIICCLSGHCHCDLSATSGGILYIGTTLACCANDIDGNARTINTENETSFDSFVVDQTGKMIYALRYGYGSNRTFDYDAASETFGEIV